MRYSEGIGDMARFMRTSFIFWLLWFRRLEECIQRTALHGDRSEMLLLPYIQGTLTRLPYDSWSARLRSTTSVFVSGPPLRGINKSLATWSL
jgi:hypothetical protein